MGRFKRLLLVVNDDSATLGVLRAFMSCGECAVRGGPIRRTHETPRPHAGRRPIWGESRSKLVRYSASSQATKTVPCLSARKKILTRRGVMAPLRTQTRRDEMAPLRTQTRRGVMALWRTQTKRLFVGLAHGRKRGRSAMLRPRWRMVTCGKTLLLATEAMLAVKPCSETLQWNPAVELAVEPSRRACSGTPR